MLSSSDSSWVRVWLTRHCVILATAIQMGKTHLEHQAVKTPPQDGQPGNVSTTFDPYANYDPQQGITTAVILGTTFVLIIVYIAFKTGWRKYRKKWCYKIPKDRSNDSAAMEMGGDHKQITISRQAIRNQRIPILVKEDSLAGSHPGSRIGDASEELLESDPVPVHTYLPCTAAMMLESTVTTQGDAYTMILSERTPSNSKRLPLTTNNGGNRSRSSLSYSTSQSPDKASVRQLLPPSANQAMRTALWVSSVTASGSQSVDNTWSEDFSPSLDKRRRTIHVPERPIALDVNCQSLEAHDMMCSVALCSGDKSAVAKNVSPDSIEHITTEV